MLPALPHWCHSKPQHAVMTAGNDNPAIRRDRGGVHEVGPAFKGADFFAAVTDRLDLVVSGGSQSLVGYSDETDRGYFL